MDNEVEKQVNSLELNDNAVLQQQRKELDSVKGWDQPPQEDW